MKIFRGSLIVTLGALIVAFLYGSWNAVIITAILGVLEISLSFDNAIVNSRILERMTRVWQDIFLTVGILIAVVGMRLVAPLVIVSVSAQLSPIEAIQLALEKGDPERPGTYGYLLNQAHPVIAAFGAMFLMMLALSFFFEDKEYWWLRWPEKILYRMGKLHEAPVIVSLVCLLFSAQFLDSNHYLVAFSGIIGILTFVLIDGLGKMMSAHGALGETETNQESERDSDDMPEKKSQERAMDSTDASLTPHSNSSLSRVEAGLAVGKSAFILFLYLEVVDASFSFDGVIGAFAMTSDPIIILLGLGFIGAMFVRSLTVYLVRKGTLDDLVYLDHGAHWAILLLSIMLLFTIKYEINDVFIGLTGAVIIMLSFFSSLWHNKKVSH